MGSSPANHAMLAELRKPRLEAAGWRCAMSGGDGLGQWIHDKKRLALIHSVALEADGHVWAHVSISRADRQLPSWEQTRDAWRVVYPDRTGVIVVPPEAEHYSIAEVMHVFGCLDDDRAIPDFTRGGASL